MPGIVQFLVVNDINACNMVFDVYLVLGTGVVPFTFKQDHLTPVPIKGNAIQIRTSLL